MKRKVYGDSGVYKYLRESGVLEQTPEDIEYARRAYWREYKKSWKKEKLKQEKAFTILFTPSELKVLAEAATVHNVSRSRFIKLAALAYVQKKYLVPNIEAIYQVKALLSLNYSALQALFDENTIPCLVGIELMQRMEWLEQEVLQHLTRPKSVGNDR